MTEKSNDTQVLPPGCQAGRQYRTRTGLTGLWVIPNAIASPTLRGYRFALTLNKSKTDPHIVPVERDYVLTYDKKSQTTRCDGKVIDEAILEAIQRTDIEGLDMITLRLLFSIFLNGVRDSIDKGTYQLSEMNLPVAKVYIPDMLEKMGRQRNLGRDAVKELMDKFHEYDNLIGIVMVNRGGREYMNYYPAIRWTAMEEETNTVSFTSPYFLKIISCIMDDAIVRDKSGLPLLEKNGKPKQRISYDYLMDPTICSEKNKRASEIVGIICEVVALGGKSGNSIPHISAGTIVSRCHELEVALNEPEVTRDDDGNIINQKPRSNSQKNRILKRAFTKALELLSSKTYLAEQYPGIRLPDPKENSNIPTMATLQSTVYEFPHDGSKKKPGRKGGG